MPKDGMPGDMTTEDTDQLGTMDGRTPDEKMTVRGTPDKGIPDGRMPVYNTMDSTRGMIDGCLSGSHPC